MHNDPEKTYRRMMKTCTSVGELWVFVNTLPSEVVGPLLAVAARHVAEAIEDGAVPVTERRRAQHIVYVLNDRSLYVDTGVPRSATAKI